MRRDPFVRWGWQLALAAGVAWLGALAVGGLSPDPDSWDCNSSWDYVFTVAQSFAFLMTPGAVWALYAAQRQHRSARWLRWAAVAVTAGSIGAAINNPIEHCANVEVMGLVLWVPATMLWFLGLLMMGGLTMTDRVLPLWAGLAVLVGVAGLIAAGEEAGFIIHAASWPVVSLALRRSGSPAFKP